jgi:hypothetical protein
MGKGVRTIGEAWKAYDQWLDDSRVGIWREAFGLDAAFRAATRPVSRLWWPKALGDCYLLAVSQLAGPTLVTFDPGGWHPRARGPVNASRCSDLARWPGVESGRWRARTSDSKSVSRVLAKHGS